MAAMPDVGTPRSVRNLQHRAQLSHRDVPSPEELMLAITRPDTPARRKTAAQAIQEAEIPDLAELLVDKVVNRTQLHALLTLLAQEGEIRRPDLTDWSTRLVSGILDRQGISCVRFIKPAPTPATPRAQAIQVLERIASPPTGGGKAAILARQAGMGR